MARARKLSSRLGESVLAGVRPGWWTPLALIVLTTVGFAQRGAGPSEAGRKPGIDLPAVAHAQISAAIGEDQPVYHARAQADGFRMENANHQVSAEFTPRGVEFRHGKNRWGMALRSFGYGDALRETAVASPRGSANRVEYRRDALTEWYLNGPLGVEQGFTLVRAPEPATGKPLTLAFVLSGNLTPSVASGGRALTLKRDDATALRYGGLTAWDADRRELRAWLEVAGGELRVQVDDSGARYPLTIDPFVQAPKLTTAKPCDQTGVCDDGAPGDQFGYSVSISADATTVVVGTPFKYTNSFNRGAAYVFVKPTDAGGWNSVYPNYYKTKLLASDGATNGLFLGYSVDVSRDGGTIVVGARRFGSGTGAAYVFVKPAFGWGTNQVQTENAKLTADPNSGGADNGSFGNGVTISGDGATIAVAAPEWATGVVASGAVYTFFRPAAGWMTATESQKFTGTLMSRYGSSLALSDDATILAVGAANENPLGGAANFVGTTHVLARRTNGGSVSYAEVAKLAPSDGLPYDLFGYSVGTAADGRTIVVGAPVMEDDTPPHAGAVYVFVRPSRGWGVPKFTMTQTAKLTASDGFENNELGQSVDVSGDGKTVVAAAIERPSLPGTIPGPGSAYLFGMRPGGWSTSTETSKTLSQDGFSFMEDRFGVSTALSGDGRVLVVGAPFQTLNANVAQGAAYVFTGSAADPVASVSPSNLTFAPQALGTTSAPKTVTLTNTGAGPLHVASVSATSQFFTTQNCVAASPIAVGASCSESVTFAPLSVEQFNGTVAFTDDGGGATSPTTQFVLVQGTGKVTNTITTITSVSSNRVLPGQSIMVSRTVTVEGGTLSPGNGMVTVQASTGESCMSPVLANGCGLTFSSPGNRTITATYEGNNSFNPSTSAPVSVDVADFSLAVTPASQSTAAKKAIYTITVTPVSGSSGTLALTCSGGPANSTCAMSPSSVSLSGTVTAKATVSLPNNAASGTYTITITGTFGIVTRSTTASLTVQ